MSDFDNTNTGAIFKNDKKESEKHPDYKGQINVNGVEYWLSAWIKTSTKTGNKFMSLSVKPKDAPAQQPAPAKAPTKAPAQGSGFDDMDDDSVPF